MKKGNKVTLAANAKINLALDVLGKRADGYHEVAMIMQSVALADKLELTEQPAEITLALAEPKFCRDIDNLAWKAASFLQQKYAPDKGVHIAIEKKIPLAAGLAGGSADAAAVLRGLNTLWNLGLSQAELCELGAVLGSDIPFCISGGTQLAGGRGEVLNKLPPLPACYVVLAKPPVGAATAWVYKHYQPEAVRYHPDIPAMIDCLHHNNLAGVAGLLTNVLETVMLPTQPVIARLKEYMIQYGAIASLMSGSGSTVFGLVTGLQQAEDIANRLRKLQLAEIFVARTVAEVE